MSVWKPDDDITPLLDEIASELGRKADSKKWIKTLNDNLFDDCGSLELLVSEDWIAMGLPVCVLTKLRLKMQKGAEPTQATPTRRLTASKAMTMQPQLSESTERRAQPGTLTRTAQKPDQLTSFADLSAFIQPSNDVRKRGTFKRRKKVLGALTCKVNIVGREGLSTALISQLASDTGTQANIIQLEVFQQSVVIELYDTALRQAEGADAIIVVFARDSLISFGKIREKFAQTAKQIEIPIILVGLQQQTDKQSRCVSPAEAAAFMEETKSLRYIQVSNEPGQARQVFAEVARAVVRQRLYSNSKVIEPITKLLKDKKATTNSELNLKKLKLTGLPNCFLYLTTTLNKLRLDSNALKYVPSEIFECLQLRELSLSSNQIEEVPSDIAKLTLLTRFDIQDNLLERLPVKELCSLTKLVELKVTGNPFTAFTEWLSIKPEKHQSALEIIHLINHGPQNRSSLTISLTKTPSSDSPKESGVPRKLFGVELPEMMKEEYKQSSSKVPVPQLVLRAIEFICIYGLPQEGIFRLTGENKRFAQIREDMEAGTIPIRFAASETPHNVTSLLKQWLRELPEPVFLFENFNKILALENLSESQQLEELTAILNSLPKENYHLLRQMFRIMFMVAQNAELNRMDEGNITKVIAPNLIYDRNEDPMSSFATMDRINDILTPLVTHYPAVFESNCDLFAIDFLQETTTPSAILHRKVSGHAKSIVSTELSSTKEFLWTADSKGTYRIWHCKDMKLVSRFDTGKKRINSLTRCGQNIWVATDDAIQVRNEETGDLVNEIPEVAFVTCAVDDKIWAVKDKNISVYDNNTFDEEKSFDFGGFPSFITKVGDTVWGVCADRKIRIWSAQSFDLVDEIDISQCGRLNSLHYIKGNVWGGSDGGVLTIWDVDTHLLKNTLEGHHSGKIFGCTEVGNLVWTYSWDGRICVYNPDIMAFVTELPMYHTDAIGGIECAYDEQLDVWWVYTASWDKSVTVWLTKSC